MKGRPRKAGARTASGALKRSSQARLNDLNEAKARSEKSVALNAPHRRGAADPENPLYESALGRFVVTHGLPGCCYVAGVAYAGKRRRYLAQMGAPTLASMRDMPGRGADTFDEELARQVAACDKAMMDQGHPAWLAVHRLLDDGPALRYEMADYAKAGLYALAKAQGYSLTRVPTSGT